MLGINYKEVPSYPVGYVEHLEMSSLDFEEFLWASGISKSLILELKNYFINKKAVPLAIHEKMLQLFKEYIVVGGMPRVVQDYVNNHDFKSVLTIQRAIIEDYKNDIAKYAFGNDKAKARECFLSIPKQLSQDYKKFRYSLVEKNGTARKYERSLMWLYDIGLINFCYNLAIPESPFEGNAREDTFKVYMFDTGLLVSMLEEGVQEDIMSGNLGIYKGAIYENIIGEMFTKLGKKLYYYEYKSQLEIDFFIKYEKMVTAIEVKSANNTKSKSLSSVLNKYNVKGIKLSTKNIGVSENIESFPLYMAMFL